MWAGLARLETTATHLLRHGLHAIDLQAEMVQPGAMRVEPFSQFVILHQGLYELQMRIAQIQVRDPEGSIVDELGEQDWEAKTVPPSFQSLFSIRYDNGYVI